MSEIEGHKSVKSDEAWKDRVKTEDAARDTQHEEADDLLSLEDAEAALDPGADLDPRHLPPANFSTLVSMLSTQAIVALGMIPDPMLGKPQPRMNLAKHLIDLLGMLEQKTKENLSVDEQRQLNSALHELRMAFVHLSQQTGPKGS